MKTTSPGKKYVVNFLPSTTFSGLRLFSNLSESKFKTPAKILIKFSSKVWSCRMLDLSDGLKPRLPGVRRAFETSDQIYSFCTNCIRSGHSAFKTRSDISGFSESTVWKERDMSIGEFLKQILTNLWFPQTQV